MGRSQTQHLNPYTGEIYTPHSDSLSGFFADVRSLHRWFMTTGEARSTARDITGAANLLFLFLLLSGSYLWLQGIHLGHFESQCGSTSGQHNSCKRLQLAPRFCVLGGHSFDCYPDRVSFQPGGRTPSSIRWREIPPERSNSAPPNPQDEPRNAVSLDVLASTAQSYSANWKTLSFSLPAPGPRMSLLRWMRATGANRKNGIPSQ